MIKVNMSDISGPIAGYLVSCITMFVAGIYILNGKTKVFDVDDCTFAVAILGGILLLCAYMCLKQSYLIDGLSFLLASVVILSISVGFMIHQFIFGDILHIVLAIAFLIIAYMSYAALDDLNVGVNVLWAVLLIVSLNVLDNMTYVISIVCILIGIVNLIMFINDWRTVRSMTADYESRLCRKPAEKESSNDDDVRNL